jgi:hypothetical protein
LIFKKSDSDTDLIKLALRTGTVGDLLWLRYWTFGLHKIQEISWLAEYLLPSEEDTVPWNLFVCVFVYLWLFVCLLIGWLVS